MKLNPDKFYVVYKPTPDSEMADIFSGRPNDMNGIRLQFRGGMKPEQVFGLYDSKTDAQKDANMLWKKHKKLDKTTTYGIYTSSGIFKFKKEFASQKDLQDYLDEMYIKGKHYAAYRITESPKKITKVQLKSFDDKIDSDDTLTGEDLDQLENLFKILTNKPASEGMVLANSFDTFLREFIPNDIWVAMGGTLNNS